MAWLRIDDGFTANSKIAQLTDAEFRVWMRLLCHCALSRDPSVDQAAIREVSGLNSRRIQRFLGLGLLDQMGSDYEVHGWASFMPKEEQNAARQAKWRARRRNAQSNAHSNADVDAPDNAEASRPRAGTRGVPSRPQSQEQPLPEPEPLLGTTRDRHPDRNGHGTGTGSDLDQLGTEPADVLHRIPRPGAAT